MTRRLPRPAICAVTSGSARRSDDAAALCALALARAAAGSGIDVVQVREPHLTDAALHDFVERAVSAVAGSRTAVLVNDRADAALAGGAHGVHLRGDSVAARRLRAISPDSWLVGRSVHSIEEARAAAADGGVDYLMFGTVFESGSKPDGHPVAGLAALEEVCRSVDLPVVAIGGIGLDRVAAVARAGAAGVAAIGMFAAAAAAGAGRVKEVVREVQERFRRGSG